MTKQESEWFGRIDVLSVALRDEFIKTETTANGTLLLLGDACVALLEESRLTFQAVE